MPNNILELLHCWKTPKEAIGKVIPALLVWIIWRERNQRLFEDCKSNVLSLKFVLLRCLLDWAVVYFPNLCPLQTYIDLVNFLNFQHFLGWSYLLYTFRVQVFCLFF
jgi:hypothetical protein